MKLLLTTCKQEHKFWWQKGRWEEPLRKATYKAKCLFAFFCYRMPIARWQSLLAKVFSFCLYVFCECSLQLLFLCIHKYLHSTLIISTRIWVITKKARRLSLLEVIWQYTDDNSLESPFLPYHRQLIFSLYSAFKLNWHRKIFARFLFPCVSFQWQNAEACFVFSSLELCQVLKFVLYTM